MRTSRLTILAIASVAALAACSGLDSTADAPTTPAGQPTPTPPPNPVDLVRKAGATPEPGAETGINDLVGGRFANGNWPGTGQEITVYTFDAPEHDATAGQTTDDIHKYICGEHFTAVLLSAQGFGAAPPDVVAERLGGKVCR